MSEPSDNDPQDNDHLRRREAAARYKPAAIDLLLVAEAPPSSLDRYFYFTHVREHDNLFRYVCRVLLGREPTREGKNDLLKELRNKGVRFWGGLPAAFLAPDDAEA